jgi:hypothetical protein
VLVVTPFLDLLEAFLDFFEVPTPSSGLYSGI